MELIKKITAKTVLGDRPERPAKGTVDLYTVYGIANGLVQRESDFGPWTKLTGSFEAVRIKDGEVFNSGACFLPEPMNSMLAAQLSQTDKEGKRTTRAVEFSIMVSVKRTDTAIGYEYVAKSLVTLDQADPLAALREKTVKALPAPTKK